MELRTIVKPGEYRSDIDVLRCSAVLAILLYHFQVKPFTGGFVGVDIFFVISGYLITGIILKESSKGVFDFLNFYGRRSRRLVPALLATVCLSFLAGYFIFFPEDFARESRATVFTLLGASNFLFWMESGYFDVDSLRKPLLHTWSLSVEFQYYAVWPPFIWFLAKAKRTATIVAALAVAALMSFVACVYIQHIDAAASFFLTPFRIWEFDAGALVFLLERRRLRNELTLEVLYFAGLILNVCCVVGYDRDMLFPGWTALPPVIGTALMIYAAPGARGSVFLDRWPVRYIGKISYSLYLVHWPILVFALYLFGPNLRPLQTAALIGLAFVMAVVLFELVESPFRGTKKIKGVSLFAFKAWCAGLIACVMAPAAYGWASNGLWAWRLSDSDVIKKINATDLEAAKAYTWVNYDRFEQADDFKTTNRRVLIVGDSQSADILNMFVEAGLDKKAEIITRRVSYDCGLPYLPEGEREQFWARYNPITIKAPGKTEQCKLYMDRLMSSPALANADVVIVVFLWEDFVRPFLSESLDAISKRARNRIWIVGSKKLSASSAQMVNNVGAIDKAERYAADSIPPDTKNLNRFLREIYGSRFVDILSAVCPNTHRCLILTDDYEPVFWDPAHFTKKGAEFIWKQGASQLFEFLDHEEGH